jgi:hypothetical protein
MRECGGQMAERPCMGLPAQVHLRFPASSPSLILGARDLHKQEPMRLSRETAVPITGRLAFPKINSATKIHAYAYIPCLRRQHGTWPLAAIRLRSRRDRSDQVSHCGICYSDLSMLENEWGVSTYTSQRSLRALALGKSPLRDRPGQRARWRENGHGGLQDAR